jgi:hypothetical protein
MKVHGPKKLQAREQLTMSHKEELTDLYTSLGMEFEH